VKQPSPAQPETDLPKLSAPAHRALATIGVSRLEQLTKFTESEIKKLHGMGPKGVRELREALEQAGLSFATKK
jgi:DNA-directed RNA polymerase alpha subunit